MTTYRIVDTDNFGGDYPNEEFVGPEYVTSEEAIMAADELNAQHPTNAPRYYKVVEMHYEMQSGFEP